MRRKKGLRSPSMVTNRTAHLRWRARKAMRSAVVASSAQRRAKVNRVAKKSKFLGGAPIAPSRITGQMSVTELIDNAFLAYNAGRLQEGCRLYTERMLDDDVTVG